MRRLGASGGPPTIVTNAGEQTPAVTGSGSKWYPLTTVQDPDVVWSVGGAARPDPAVFNGLAFTGTATPDNSLDAIDVATGEYVWRSSLSSSPNGEVAAGGGRVYSGNADGAFAVDITTGEQLWFTSFSDRVRGGVTYNPNTDVVYVGSDDQSVTALDAETGNEVWKYTQPADLIRARLPLSDGVLYGGAGDTAFALDASTGDPVWESTLADGQRADVALGGGQLAVGTRDGVEAFDAADGADEWTTSFGVGMTAIIAGGGDFFVTDANNTLTRLNTFGSVRADDQLPTETVSLGYDGGFLYVGDGIGQFSKYTVPDSIGLTRDWQINPGGGFITDMVISDGRAILGNDNGLFSIRVQPGEEYRPVRISNGDEWTIPR